MAKRSNNGIKFKANSVILWEGASELDGDPIMVIATGFKTKSANGKTGGMIQTYIIRRDMRPTDAIKSGSDASICGDCVHRGDGTGKKRTCYVNLGQGPLSVFNAWLRGTIPHINDVVPDSVAVGIEAKLAFLGTGRKIRLGSYGESTAAPVWLWSYFLMWAEDNTGYTHQWRDPQFAAFKEWCMASADTEAQAREAQAAGWRTFRVRLPGDMQAINTLERTCPASKEAGKKTVCAQCMACGGNHKGQHTSIAINGHGSSAVVINFPALAARRAA
jgi:hypothetical protein